MVKTSLYNLVGIMLQGDAGVVVMQDVGIGLARLGQPLCAPLGDAEAVAGAKAREGDAVFGELGGKERTLEAEQAAPDGAGKRDTPLRACHGHRLDAARGRAVLGGAADGERRELDGAQPADIVALGGELLFKVGGAHGLGPGHGAHRRIADGAQVGHMAPPDVFARFGHAAAVGVEKGFDGLAAVRQHLSPRRADGGRRGRLFGDNALVELAVRRRAEVIALSGMAAAALEGKAARGDALRLEGLGGPVGRHLLGHDAQEVVIDRHDVDGGQARAPVAQLERAAVAAAIERQSPIRLVGWADEQYLAAQLLAADEEGAVLPAHIIRLPRCQRDRLARLRPGHSLAGGRTDGHAPLPRGQPDAQIRPLLRRLGRCHGGFIRLGRRRRMPRHSRGSRSKHQRAD